MADLSIYYSALQKADAAGDTSGAKQLADYIRSQSVTKPQSMDYMGTDTSGNPIQVPTSQAKYSPTSGNSFLQNVAAGAGSMVSDAWLAGKQTFGYANGQDAADKRAIDAPLMATGGGKTGKVLGGIGIGVPLSFIPGANTYVGAAALGGLMGAANPVTDSESRLLNTGIGAGIGIAGKYGTDKLGQWLSAQRAAPQVDTGLNPTQIQRAAQGQGLGFQLTPGQATGDPALQKLDAALASKPFTSAPFDAIARNNTQAMNRVSANAIGESGNVVDASVLESANTRLGEIFDKAGDPSKIVSVAPGQTKGVIDQIEQGVQGMLPNNGVVRDNGLVRSIEDTLNKGSATADQLRQWTSKLGKVAYKNMTSQSGDRDLGQALYAVKDHVDDLLQASMEPAQQAEYASARQQYRTLMQLTSRVGVVNPSSGNVSGATLANALQQKDKAGFLFNGNQSDLYNAARFTQTFKDAVGNSGTATRMQGGFKDMLLGIPGNLASWAYTTKPGTATAQAILGGPKALGRGAVVAADEAFPMLQHSLPGLSGLGVATLVPYITQ